jgi:hypothetical protein
VLYSLRTLDRHAATLSLRDLPACRATKSSSKKKFAHSMPPIAITGLLFGQLSTNNYIQLNPANGTVRYNRGDGDKQPPK